MTVASPMSGRARTKKDGLTSPSAAHEASEMASHPAAIMSASAVFPAPPCADDGDQPGIQRHNFGRGPRRIKYLHIQYHLRRHRTGRRLTPHIGAPVWINTSLFQAIECQTRRISKQPASGTMRGKRPRYHPADRMFGIYTAVTPAYPACG